MNKTASFNKVGLWHIQQLQQLQMLSEFFGGALFLKIYGPLDICILHHRIIISGFSEREWVPRKKKKKHTLEELKQNI
jgi:hypothetical protein